MTMMMLMMMRMITMMRMIMMVMVVSGDRGGVSVCMILVVVCWVMRMMVRGRGKRT